MTPSGHTLPANTGKGQQMSVPTTHHGIAVGVDGSAPSKVAVDWAAREASLRGLPLTLVHVIPSSLTRMWPQVPTPPELREWHKLNGHEILRQAAGRRGRGEGTQRYRGERPHRHRQLLLLHRLRLRPFQKV